MGNSRNTGYLQNTVKVADNGDISLMHGSTMLMQISSSGAITTTGVISGSNALSASYAATASFVTLAQTASFVTTAQTASFVTTAQTASFVANAQSASNAVTAQTASFANTFTVASTLTAQTLVVQTITSSVDFVTGSTRFGSIIGNTHQFTGSMSITGSSIINSTGNALRISSLATGSNVQLYITNNNNGDIYAGVAASDGSSVFTGTSAYGGYIGTNLNVPFHFATNGTVKMTITGSNVGIGTTSPSTLLQVAGTSTFGASNSNGDVTIISNAGPFQIKGRTDYDRTFLALTWETSPDAGVIVGNTLRFNVSASWGTNIGTTALTILANGNVGIGTTSPTRKLDVNGTSIFRDFTTVVSSNGNTVSNITWLSTDSGIMTLHTGGNAAVQLNSNGVSYFNGGDVGIGNTSPTAYTNYRILHIGDASRIGLIKFGTGTSTNGPEIYTTSGNNINFNSDNANTRMVISGSGNIGIGTTSPNAKLDVYNGTARFWHGNTTNYTEFNNSNEINHFASNGTSAKMYLNWLAGGDVNIARNAIQAVSSGNVGIGEGANSIARLNVNGSTKINRSFYNWYQGYWTGNSTYWHMKTNMSAGAGGNTQYTMSLFKGYMYSYSSVAINEGAVGFHNWSGIIYALATTGNLFTTVYVSSDGYVVLVIPSGSGETGVTIDWHQAYGYPFVNAQVTAAKLHGSPTGGY